MKKLIALILIVSAAFYYYMIYDAKKVVRVLRVGMECANVPNNWEEDHPTDTNFPILNRTERFAEGYDVQIAKLIAQKLKSQLVISKFAWEELLHALNNKQVDVIISGMPDFEEYKQQAIFSDTYDVTKTEYVLMVHKDGKYSSAKTLADFSGAAILGQRATKLDEVIYQIPGVIHVAPVELIENMVKALNDKKVDGIVMKLETAQSYERANPDLEVIRFPEGEGFQLGFSGICVAVRTNETKLLQEINIAIENISISQRKRIMDQTISRIWENL